METMIIKQDTIKMSHEFTELGKEYTVTVTPSTEEVANTTSGRKLIMKNIFSIKLEGVVLVFRCNVLHNDHTYSRLSSIYKNGKHYSAQRYLNKYSRLCSEVAYALGLSYRGTTIC